MAGSSSSAKHKHKYADLRYIFIRGLCQHERRQRGHVFLKSAAECTSRAIVSLDLSLTPIKSIRQAAHLQAIGGEMSKILKSILQKRSHSKERTLDAQCPSSSSAILIALLILLQQQKTPDSQNMYISEDKLKETAESICEENFVKGNEAGFCTSWWRMEVLIRRGFIKRRSQKKATVYELLPAGRDLAVQLCDLYSFKISTDASSTTHDPGPEQHDVDLDALYVNNANKDGVVMLVDTREWGGDRVGLGQLCRLLQHNGISYRTQQLRCGDYAWIKRHKGLESEIPTLVERKRADDLADSIHNGRFWSQISRMLDWRHSFVVRDEKCSLHYIVEGDPEAYVVRCTDGCQGVGRCKNPTVQQVQAAIRDLERYPNINVHRTANMEDTVRLLTQFNEDLSLRYSNKDITNDHIVVDSNAPVANEKSLTELNVTNFEEQHNPKASISGDQQTSRPRTMKIEYLSADLSLVHSDIPVLVKSSSTSSGHIYQAEKYSPSPSHISTPAKIYLMKSQTSKKSVQKRRRTAMKQVTETSDSRQGKDVTIADKNLLNGKIENVTEELCELDSIPMMSPRKTKHRAIVPRRMSMTYERSIDSSVAPVTIYADKHPALVSMTPKTSSKICRIMPSTIDRSCVISIDSDSDRLSEILPPNKQIFIEENCNKSDSETGFYDREHGEVTNWFDLVPPLTEMKSKVLESDDSIATDFHSSSGNAHSFDNEYKSTNAGFQQTIHSETFIPETKGRSKTSDHDKVEQISDMFPQFTNIQIAAVLLEHNGILESAISALLEMDVQFS